MSLRTRVIYCSLASALLLCGVLCPPVWGAQSSTPRPVNGKTFHVWKESPAPTRPYLHKFVGAHKVQEALDLAKPGDTVLVHGDCKTATGRCLYEENVIVPCGVTLRGDGSLPAIPFLDGGGKGSVVRGRDLGCPDYQITQVLKFEIQNGRTRGSGGGISFQDRRARIIENCIHENHASRGGGVAIVLTDNSLTRPTVEIEGNLIEKNIAFERGGGVSLQGNSDNPGKIKDWHATFSGNTVRENKVNSRSGVRWGGGLDAYSIRVRARRNLFEQNTIEGEDLESYGAHVGVLNHDENNPLTKAAALTLKFVVDIDPEQFLSEGNIYRSGGKTEDGNIRGGGAIAAIWNASVRLVRDWISDNHANTGGAVYVNVRSLLEVDASHIENNVAQGDGGATYVVCGSRVDVNGDNLIESNIANGRSDVTGDRLKKKGWPTLYPRGGGGLFVRNAQARFRGRNIIRKNKARGMAVDTVGFGGGLLLWQVDKALLFDELIQARAELEALVCNCLTHLSVKGDNLFHENTAENEGGGIAILLEQDNLGVTQSAGGVVLGSRSFERSEILEGTQLRGNIVTNPTADTLGAGGIYYHDSLLPGARQPGDSKWAKGQAIIRGILIEGNQGSGLKIVDAGMHLANGRLEWLSPALEVSNSLIKANSTGGIQMWSSWPRIVGNRLVSNQGEQIYIQSTTHLPVLSENDLDGANVSEVGVSVISAPADGASPRWANRLEQNNLVRHKRHAAELTLNDNSLHMERNYWGANGVVVDSGSGSPNSVSGSILTQPPLPAAVNITANAFRSIDVKIVHPTTPPLPDCRGIQRSNPPGVPEEPPRRPPPDVPTVPQQPQTTPPSATPSPLQPAPTPDRPQSVPEQTPRTQPSPSPEQQPSPTPNQPRTPNQQRPANEWSFSVPAGQIAPSTIAAENFCSRRHRFEITLQNLPFIRLVGRPTFEVSAGRVHAVAVEIDSRGLAPDEYTGVVIVRCVTCSGEVGCSQDRTVIPVRMIVKPRV